MSSIPIENNGHDAPTPGPEWRVAREIGFLQQLPSGNWARLRPVTPDLLIESGEVPDLLTPLVVRMLYDGIDAEGIDAVLEPSNDLEQTKDSISLINLVCRMSFVKPVIVDNPQAEDEIGIHDLTLFDRGHVFALATRGAVVLRTFRLEPTADVEPIPDEPG